MSVQHEWWQRGVIYQIYPRSFQDSNGDGIGDLRGVLNRLDYLAWLGVDAIWLSPIYPSPMADFGYDISNYTDIDPMFGTLADFDDLLAQAHRRGIKVILDFVPNHTSDQHPWFQESRSSRTSPKRNWYIWRDPGPGGGPPNNWLSNFGGGAWEFDDRTGQYYYHAFLKEQPDLNWRNPEVRQAMLDVLRFWLERGVDGFRVDVIWHIVKDEEFRDNPLNPDYGPGQPPHHELLATYNTDRPEVHDIIAEMRRVFDQYGERMFVGEIYLPVERLVTYYGAHGSGVHLPFNFQLIHLPWNARAIERAINNYEAALPPYGWPNWVLGNHDQPRIASRVGAAQARIAAMLLLTLRGTPTMYYGDEIGMHSVPIPPEMVQDPFEKNTPGMGFGRDPQRTPMQWTAEKGAGFTAGHTWLPLAADYERVNVDAQRDDPRSLLTFCRRLLALRRQQPALAIGDYHAVPADGDLLAYMRTWEEKQFLVVLNLGHRDARYDSEAPIAHGRILLSTHLDRECDEVHGSVELRPDEAVVIQRGETCYPPPK
jgi:alpha-glucosidase